jgi:glycosyltransferase involved in cell wall biosynthesis
MAERSLESAPAADGSGTVAYVLKGYPRVSELFIASEIWRLERLGVALRLYVVKPADEDTTHPVVDRIAAVPSYLPATSPLSNAPLLPWLRTNAPPFLPALRRLVLRHPWRFVRAAGAAAAQSIRARKGWRPRSIYVKEFLHAVEIADRVSRAGDVTHLHGHFAHGTATVTWLASLLTGLPFSFTAHAKDIYRSSLNPAGLLARKMRAARFVVTCTGANRDHLRAVEPTTPVHVVYHGLNVELTELLADQNGETPPPERAAGPLRVASVGRLVPKKGFDILLGAVRELTERGTAVQLTIAGEDGEAGESVRQLIDELGLSSTVRMVGPVSQPGLLDLYRSVDVFALACRVTDDGDRDGIPNVLVEAMAAGLPVVSTAVSGIPEIVRDESNGLLVDPGDSRQLADALLRLEKDPLLRNRLGRAARATVTDRFDGDVLAESMAELLLGSPR